jgi:NAD(P) transhydrogenase subunit alpha
MIVGVLKEPSFENRVSLLADGVALLKKKDVEVWVEPEAGLNAAAPDEQYLEAGAVLKSRGEILTTADVLLAIHPVSPQDLFLVKSSVLIGIYQPLFYPHIMEEWATNGLTTFSLDMLPRTTRAQSMDVLSSQANIAGYKAVLLAANVLPRYFPMLMTAAGSVPPAKMLILGAGVAGLQAIATAKRLGAVVEVFDTRPAVKEEVMSLGAKFIEVEGAASAAAAKGYAVEQSEEFLARQRERIAEAMAKSDVVITTAQIPGKKAPLLIFKQMIAGMKKGSVIIDLAAATGGNTEVTRNEEIVYYEGVTVIGRSNLASLMPFDASRLYGKNVLNFLSLLIAKEGTLNIDFADDLVKGCCITKDGKLIHERVLAISNPVQS